LEQFLGEWRGLAAGVCDVIALHSWGYYEAGWPRPGGLLAFYPDG
jgi:hypothetical protein